MNKQFSLEELYPVMEEVLNSGGEFKIISGGTSMLPMLEDGKDTIVLIKNPSKLKKGDVPLYKRKDGKYVLHRVIKAKNGVYKMRGDNHYISEQPIYNEQIIAILKAYIKNGKRIECTDFKYRIYTFYVLYCFPLRFVLKKSRKILSRIKHKIIKKSAY